MSTVEFIIDMCRCIGNSTTQLKLFNFLKLYKNFINIKISNRTIMDTSILADLHFYYLIEFNYNELYNKEFKNHELNNHNNALFIKNIKEIVNKNPKLMNDDIFKVPTNIESFNEKIETEITIVLKPYNMALVADEFSLPITHYKRWHIELSMPKDEIMQNINKLATYANDIKFPFTSKKKAFLRREQKNNNTYTYIVKLHIKNEALAGGNGSYKSSYEVPYTFKTLQAFDTYTMNKIYELDALYFTDDIRVACVKILNGTEYTQIEIENFEQYSKKYIIQVLNYFAKYKLNCICDNMQHH